MAVQKVVEKKSVTYARILQKLKHVEVDKNTHSKIINENEQIVNKYLPKKDKKTSQNNNFAKMAQVREETSRCLTVQSQQ